MKIAKRKTKGSMASPGPVRRARGRGGQRVGVGLGGVRRLACELRRVLGSPQERVGAALHHSPPFGAKFGWTTAPSRVSAVAFTSSSSQLILSSFASLSISVSAKA